MAAVPKNRFSDAKLQQAANMRDKRLTWAEIEESLRISPEESESFQAAVRRRKRVADVRQPERDTAEKDLQIAALKQQLEELRRTPDRPPVQSVVAAPEQPSAIDEWRKAEDVNEQKLASVVNRHRFQAELGDSRPIGVAFASDQHISVGNLVDLKRMREDAELIADTDGMYSILGGDGVDNHIKHRSAILAARSQPDQQWRMYDYYLSILASSMLVMCSGNHDHWTNQFAGVDMVNRLAESNKLHYSPHEARIDISLGSAAYKLAIRHQYRFNSSLNLCHTVKRWWDMGSEPFDIGVICHHHEAATEMFTRHGKHRFAARPGSYQIVSDYSDQYGFNRNWPTCPTFVLYPNEHRIVAFADLRDGVEWLKQARN
jgi:hypothetical protein